MGVIVDTNVILDIFNDDADWFEWSNSRLEELKDQHISLVINPIIYCELSVWFDNFYKLDESLFPFGLTWEEIPKEGLFLTAKAFSTYRQRSGIKNRPLPDFFIGGHAMSQKYTVLTRDPTRFNFYFPKLKLITPEKKK